MKNSTGYKTKQRSEVLGVLEKSNGEHITAKQVHERLEKEGSTIGSATVYRQLEKLVEEGLVRRYSLGPGEAACYSYAADESCDHDHCFHCVCTKCGKLYHVECDHLAEIAGHLASEHGFTVDPSRTVFYGICESCSKKSGE